MTHPSVVVVEVPVTPCQVLTTIEAARRELDAWEAQVRAYQTNGQPGQIMAAARAAAVVTATLAGAACDTRSIARDASVTAFLEVA